MACPMTKSLSRYEITRGRVEKPALAYADPKVSGYPPLLGQRCKRCNRLGGGLYISRGLRKCGAWRDCTTCGLRVRLLFSPLPEAAREYLKRTRGDFGHRDDDLCKR